MRDASVKTATEKIDKLLDALGDRDYMEVSIADMQGLIGLTMPDQQESERVWDSIAVGESIAQFAKLYDHDTGYVYVDRARELEAARRETQGILTGGESAAVPDDKITLFLLRTKPGRGRNASWWPQIRFPDGQYAFAFSV